MSWADIPYDVAIIHDGTPSARRFAVWLSRRLRTHSFCRKLPAGGTIFAPPELMDETWEPCLHAILHARQLVIAQSTGTKDGLALQAGDSFGSRTGVEPLKVFCDKEKSSRERFMSRYPEHEAAIGLRAGVFRISRLPQLKAKLAEESWMPSQERSLRARGVVLRIFLTLVLLVLLMVGIPLARTVTEEARMVEMFPTNQFHVTNVYGWSYFSEDGTLYADLQADGMLLVRRTTDSAVVQILQTEFSGAPAVDYVFSPDKKMLLVYNKQATVLYDLVSGKQAHVFAPCTYEHLRGSFLASGKLLAFTEYDSNVCHEVSVWNAETFSLVYRQEDVKVGIPFTGFTKDGAYLIGQDENLFLIRLADGVKIEGKAVFPNLSGNVDLPSFSSDGQYMVESHDTEVDRQMTIETRIQVRACQDGRVLSTFQIRDFGYPNIYFDRNNRLIVSKTQYLAIYDPLTGACSSKASTARKPNHQYGTALIPDSRYAVTSITNYPEILNDRLTVFSARDGRAVAQFTVDGSVEMIEVYPESKTILALLGSGNTYVFRYAMTDGGIRIEGEE